jgi:hypothetical protein
MVGPFELSSARIPNNKEHSSSAYLKGGGVTSPVVDEIYARLKVWKR